ncbi:MAG TPA: hypothetical protein DEO64_06220 [Alcaligenes faecalis]|nr:hypothetical protein [Alcaligenes faecalis]
MAAWDISLRNMDAAASVQGIFGHELEYAQRLGQAQHTALKKAPMLPLWLAAPRSFAPWSGPAVKKAGCSPLAKCTDKAGLVQEPSQRGREPS